MIPDVVSVALADPEGGAALLGALIGALSSLLVALVTGLLTRDKFQRELLWDKRLAACNEVLSHLQASAKFAEAIREGFSDDTHAFYASDQLVKLHDKYGDEVGAAHLAFQSSYLLLPPAFRRRYERLDRERSGTWYYSAGPDAYLEPMELNECARRDLFDLARAELGLAPRGTRSVLRWRASWSMARASLSRSVRKIERWRRNRNKQSDDWDF